MKILILLAISILFYGCGVTEVKIPEKQYIPVKCKINTLIPPKKIAKDETDYEGILLDAKAISVYTELLEKDLDFCVKGEIK